MNNDCEFLEMFISLSGVEALLKTKHGYANGGSCFKLSFVAAVRRRSDRCAAAGCECVFNWTTRVIGPCCARQPA